MNNKACKDRLENNGLASYRPQGHGLASFSQSHSQSHKNQKGACAKKAKTISYRLKCARTANGLSHYVMYGDVDKKQALL